MLHHLTPAFLAEATGGTLFAPADTPLTSVVIDSRRVTDGSLFVAIPGQRVDGHDYVEGAIAAGAACALVQRPISSSLPHVLVENTSLALGRLARAHRGALSPITVGVTGSVGKTTTKQLISSVLATDAPTLYTEGNLNNELGLPLTLLSLTDQHRYAVLEMGMSERGEIAYLSEIAKPDIGVITCIGTSHIESLGSREAIAQAKLELVCGLSADGTLILNGDEPLLAGYDALYVGFEPHGERFLRIDHTEKTENGTLFLLSDELGRRYPAATVPGSGSHLVLDAALAYATGLVAGLSPEQIVRGIATFQNTGMRQHIEPFGGLRLLIDCYNAAPESMRAALSVLKEEKKDGRGIAVLGDMLELGSYSPALHEQVGRDAYESGVDLLLTFGPLSFAIAKGAIDAGMEEERVWSFPDTSRPEECAEALKRLCRDGDTILFKASRGIALERVIKAFKEI